MPSGASEATLAAPESTTDLVRCTLAPYIRIEKEFELDTDGQKKQLLGSRFIENRVDFRFTLKLIALFRR